MSTYKNAMKFNLSHSVTYLGILNDMLNNIPNSNYAGTLEVMDLSVGYYRVKLSLINEVPYATVFARCVYGVEKQIDKLTYTLPIDRYTVDKLSARLLKTLHDYMEFLCSCTDVTSPDDDVYTLYKPYVYMTAVPKVIPVQADTVREIIANGIQLTQDMVFTTTFSSNDDVLAFVREFSERGFFGKDVASLQYYDTAVVMTCDETNTIICNVFKNDTLIKTVNVEQDLLSSYVDLSAIQLTMARVLLNF